MHVRKMFENRDLTERRKRRANVEAISYAVYERQQNMSTEIRSQSSMPAGGTHQPIT